MSQDDPRQQEEWSALADRILTIAREIAFRGYTDERAVRLSQSEAMVMRFLQDEPTSTPSHIAQSTGLQRTNMSAVLRGLESKGLIERRPGGADGRAVEVVLTTRGRQNYELVRREWGTTIAEAVGADTANLKPGLALLAQIETGLTRQRRS